jgi:trk system potassium uptake protein TrkA
MPRRQIGVIGLGNFGAAVARTLARRGTQVLCVDRDMERVRAIKDEVTYAVQAEATDEQALRAVGMAEADTVVISLGQDIGTSLLAVMIIQELHVPHIVAKAVNPLHARLLTKLGVQRVVFPEQDMGRRVADLLLAPRVVDHLELAEGFAIDEIVPPDHFVGRSIRELEVRARYGVTIVAIRRVHRERGEPEFLVNPSVDENIRRDDVLVVIGETARLEKLR